jgi:NADPH:quinone reductase-like Zn-dependent oxidoreductase
MRAALVREFGGHENIRVDESVPMPEVGEKQVMLAGYFLKTN